MDEINKLTNKKSKTTNITEIKQDNETLTNKNGYQKLSAGILVNLDASLQIKYVPQSLRRPESYVSPSESQFKMENVSATEVYKLISTIEISRCS